MTAGRLIWMTWTLILTVTVSPAESREPDWTLYNQLLTTFTHTIEIEDVRQVRVDYESLRHSDLIPRLAGMLARFNPRLLQTTHEKIAFYLNAYNILAMKMVIDHWPLESIRDAGSLFRPVWKRRAGQIGGEPVTLHQIEHQILRPLGDPRIHMALVCASRSCPDLRREAYTAARIDAQLDDQSQRFLKNPVKGLRIDKKTAHASRIFDWFEGDFETYGGVKHFLRTYRPDLPPDFQLETDIPYDWRLNT